MITYADDTVLLYSCSNLDDLLKQINSDLTLIASWFTANNLTLNLTKTKYIHFSLRHSDLNLNLKYHSSSCIRTNQNCPCHSLESVKCIKYLGLNIDSNLKWKSHINDLAKKLRFILIKLYHLNHKVNLSFLRTLYYAWFYSLINYAVIIWGGEYRSNLQSLVSIQNRCFKLFNCYSFNSSNFRSLKLLPIRHNAYFRICLYLHRNKHLCNFKVKNYNSRSNKHFKFQTFLKISFVEIFLSGSQTF